MNRLYIIGNGFDKAHGLKTSYWNFREFLEEKYPRFLYKFERLYGYELLDSSEYGYSDELQRRWNESVNKDLWSEFERGMSSPDIQAMLDYSESVAADMDLESGNIGIRDTLDAHWKSEYGFIEKLHEHIREWISQVDLDGAIVRRDDLVGNNEDLFFTFNYTHVLENVYGVAQVLHIHGSAEDNYIGDPIIGHCDHLEIEKRYQFSRDADEKFDEALASVQYAIADYLEKIYKDTDFLIRTNQCFFEKLKNIDRIIIIGWSAGEVDIPYLKAIRNSVNKNATWTVFYYDAKAYKSLRRAFDECNINNMFDVEFIPSEAFWDQ